MKLWLTVPIALLAGAAHCQPADVVPDALARRLVALAGTEAQDCGTLLRESDRRAAIACATNATTSGQAWRLAEQLEGTESSIWQGGVRDSHGGFHVVFYEADLSAARGSGPTVSTLLCREILFAAKGGDAMECQPIPGIR